MKPKSKKSGTNTSTKKTVAVHGTGKSGRRSPTETHKRGGAVYEPRKAKGPLDNRARRGSK